MTMSLGPNRQQHDWRMAIRRRDMVSSAFGPQRTCGSPHECPLFGEEQTPSFMSTRPSPLSGVC